MWAFEQHFFIMRNKHELIPCSIQMNTSPNKQPTNYVHQRPQRGVDFTSKLAAICVCCTFDLASSGIRQLLFTMFTAPLCSGISFLRLLSRNVGCDVCDWHQMSALSLCLTRICCYEALHWGIFFIILVCVSKYFCLYLYLYLQYSSLFVFLFRSLLFI